MKIISTTTHVNINILKSVHLIVDTYNGEIFFVVVI